MVVIGEESRVDIGRIEEYEEEGCISKREEDEECRICHEEAEKTAMETPCACNGTLKFAHRKCIQKWCNQKGNITCEICNQIFTPNYSASPARTTIHSDDIAIDISWMSAQYHGQLLATIPDDFNSYSIQHSMNITFCHVLILILMLLLLAEHFIMVAKDSIVVKDKAFFNVSIVQIAVLFFHVIL
ncbi:hypothetical protein ZOSMA_125G00090 [Zostera marina]|uniref:Uncharacterized protein n=1 Tax=Zostera marina TaxID=29655 RepID=A0A0K9PZU2_ZOSMR|nr:hypothetical protein ZOSMA_125G00090 [Zostera marina]